MSTELKSLLVAQLHVFEWIEKVIVNYKKLSKDSLMTARRNDWTNWKSDGTRRDVSASPPT